MDPDSCRTLLVADVNFCFWHRFTRERSGCRQFFGGVRSDPVLHIAAVDFSPRFWGTLVHSDSHYRLSRFVADQKPAFRVRNDYTFIKVVNGGLQNFRFIQRNSLVVLFLYNPVHIAIPQNTTLSWLR